MLLHTSPKPKACAETDPPLQKNMTSFQSLVDDVSGNVRPETVAETTAAIEQLEAAINSVSEADLHPAFRAVHHDRLADLYFSRYEHTGDEGDLEATRVQSANAADFGKRASTAPPPGHSKPEQWHALQGNRLNTRYERFWEPKDLDDAIDAYERALETVPDGVPLRSVVLTNQANCLCSRYEHEGDVQDIDSAISKAQQALDLAGSNAPAIKNDLSTMHLSKFEKEGNVDDLDSAIALAKEAVDATPDNDRRLPTRLLNLANGLNTRYGRHEEFHHLEETVAALKKAEVAGRQHASDCLPQILCQLAHALYTQYSRASSEADLFEAIKMVEEALKLIDEDESHADTRRKLTRLLHTCSEEAKELEDSATEPEIAVEA